MREALAANSEVGPLLPIVQTGSATAANLTWGLIRLHRRTIELAIMHHPNALLRVPASGDARLAR